MLENMGSFYLKDKHPNSLDGRRNIKDVILGLFDASPRYVYGSPSPNVVRKLEKVLDEEIYDIVIADALYVTNYLWGRLNQLDIPRVLVEHNVESLIQKQRIVLADDWVSKTSKIGSIIAISGVLKKRLATVFDHFVVVSDDDRKELTKLWSLDSTARIELVPNGVDVSYYAAVEGHPEPGRIVFNGALTYEGQF